MNKSNKNVSAGLFYTHPHTDPVKTEDMINKARSKTKSNHQYASSATGMRTSNFIFKPTAILIMSR